MVFGGWFVSLSMLFSRSIHVAFLSIPFYDCLMFCCPDRGRPDFLLYLLFLTADSNPSREGHVEKSELRQRPWLVLSEETRAWDTGSQC